MGKIKRWLIDHRDKDASVLFGPPFVVMILDLFLTIFGQPTSYWENFSNPNELNVLGCWLLEIHPLLFIYLFLVYLVLIYLLFIYAGKIWKFVLFNLIMVYHAPPVWEWLSGGVGTIIKNLPENDRISHAQVFSFIEIVLVFLLVFLSGKVWIAYFESKKEQNKPRKPLC